MKHQPYKSKHPNHDQSLFTIVTGQACALLRKASSVASLVVFASLVALQAAMGQSNINLTLKTFTGNSSEAPTRSALASAGLDVANTGGGDRAVLFDVNGAHFGARGNGAWWAARNYLRTLQSYYPTSYTAYITIDRRNSASSICFGMGGGVGGNFGEPDVGTGTNSAILFFAGNGSGNGQIRVVINGAQTQVASGISLGADGGKNVMRVKMTYLAVDQTIQFDLDHSYNGLTFSTDYTSPIFNVANVNGLGLDLMTEWSGGAAAKIYFGGDGDGGTVGVGSIYTDFAVTTGVQTTVPVAFSATMPVNGYTATWMLPVISASINDGSVATVVDASVNLYQDAVLVASGGGRSGTNIFIAYTNSTALLPGSTHSSMVTCTDSEGNNLTNFWSWTVSNYKTVPASYALAAPAANPGMLVNAFATEPLGPGPKATPGIIAAEQQIAGGLVDENGTPYPNLASPSSGSDLDVNWSLSGSAGNFNAATPPEGTYADREHLGVGPSSPNFVFDNFTHEVNAYLRLSAGNYRMLVNSDDGFKVTVAPGLGNPDGTVLGGFLTGIHPASDVAVDFVITTAGDYPFRLLYYQAAGGASTEWMIQNMSTGEKVLINDLSNPSTVLAFQSGSPRATLTKMLPANGYGPGSINQAVQFQITDGLTALTGTPVLVFDGSPVVPSIVSGGGVTTISWSSPVPHVYGSMHTAQLIWTENTTPSPTMWTNTTSFTVRQPFLADLPNGTFWLEAADYDFGGGQMVPAANDMFAYNGDGYQQDLTPGDGSPYFPLLNVDYYNNPGNGTPGTYRGNHSLHPTLPGNQVGIEANSGASTLRPNGASVSVSRNIGWMNPSIWGNYTRTLPNGIYSPVISIGAPGKFGSAVSLVKAGLGTTNQTLHEVGKTQNATGTGGYGSYQLRQLANADGGPAAIYVNGPGGANTITLRWNFGLPNNPNFQLNAGWMALTPITNVPPVIAAVSPLNGATGVNPNGQLVFSVQTYDRPVNVGSIALQFNGNAVVPTVLGPDSSGVLTVSYTYSGLPYSSTNTYSLSLADTGNPAPVVARATSGMFVAMAQPIPPSTPISFQQVGSQLILNWSQGVLLQATNVAGPWIPNVSATSPFTNAMDQPMMFYRVQIWP